MPLSNYSLVSRSLHAAIKAGVHASGCDFWNGGDSWESIDNFVQQICHALLKIEILAALVWLCIVIQIGLTAALRAAHLAFILATNWPPGTRNIRAIPQRPGAPTHSPVYPC